MAINIFGNKTVNSFRETQRIPFCFCFGHDNTKGLNFGILREVNK